MADVKQDLFTLEYSPGFEIQGTQEANIDLELTAANTNSATVYGTVTDGTSPIANATVKLLTALVCLTNTHSPMPAALIF